MAVVVLSLIALYLYSPIGHKLTSMEDGSQETGKQVPVSEQDLVSSGITVSDSMRNANNISLGRSLEDKIEGFGGGDDYAAIRAVLFEYWRSGNYKDTVYLIKKAFERNLISSEEYFGELAHVLSISYDRPKEIIDEILSSGNDYGKEVLFANLSANAGIYEKLTAEERNDVLGMLEKSRPRFDPVVKELGLFDIYMYESWLGSIRTIKGGTVNFCPYLDGLISNNLEDPREIVAMMYSFPKSELESHLGPHALARLKDAAFHYKRSYPDNSVANLAFEKYEEPQ